MTPCEEAKAVMNESRDFLQALKCPKAKEIAHKITTLLEKFEQQCPAAKKKDTAPM